MEEAGMKTAVTLAELGSSGRHLQPSACHNLPSSMQLYTCLCECAMAGNHSKWLHLFQFSISTIPVNVFLIFSSSTFLLGCRTRCHTCFRTGRERWGESCPRSGMISLYVIAHFIELLFSHIFIFALFCLVQWLNLGNKNPSFPLTLWLPKRMFVSKCPFVSPSS